MAIPKILLIGHGRHGKDTVAKLLQKNLGMKFSSSSFFVAKRKIWPDWGIHRYSCFEEMFNDRANHREMWADLISEYNSPDKTRTSAEMLAEGNDMYVGMRRRDELDACALAGIFDLVIWVDRSKILSSEDFSSMELTVSDAQYTIDNNSDLNHLNHQIGDFAVMLSMIGWGPGSASTIERGEDPTT